LLQEKQQWEEERQQWQDAVNRCSVQIEFLNRSLLEAAGELHRLRESHSSLQASLEAAERQALEAQSSRDSIGKIAMKELKRAGACVQYLLEFELDAHKTTCGDLETARQQIQRFIQEYKCDMERLQAERARTAEQNLRSRELCEGLCRHLREAQSDCAAWREALREHEEQMKSLQNQLSSVKGQLRKQQTELRDSLRGREAEIARLQNESARSHRGKDEEIARLQHALRLLEQNFKSAAELRDADREQYQDCVRVAEFHANAQISNCRRLEEELRKEKRLSAILESTSKATLSECKDLKETVKKLESTAQIRLFECKDLQETVRTLGERVQSQELQEQTIVDLKLQVANYRPFMQSMQAKHQAEKETLQAEIERLRAALPAR
jgi:chromosome segregation ATPase